MKLFRILLIFPFMLMGFVVEAQFEGNEQYCSALNYYGLPCEFKNSNGGSGAYFGGYVAVPGYAPANADEYLDAVKAGDTPPFVVAWCEYLPESNFKICDRVKACEEGIDCTSAVAITPSALQQALTGQKVIGDALEQLQNLSGSADIQSVLVNADGAGVIFQIIAETRGFFAPNTAYFAYASSVPKSDRLPEEWMGSMAGASTFAHMDPKDIARVWNPVAGAVVQTLAGSDGMVQIGRTNSAGYFVIPYGFYKKIYSVVYSASALPFVSYPSGYMEVGNLCSQSPQMPVYVRVAFGNFNPRAESARYFVMTAVGQDCSNFSHANFPVDVIQVSGKVCMTNDIDGVKTDCANLQLIPVPNMSGADNPDNEDTTEYFTAQTDGSTAVYNRAAGLVRQLSVSDFSNTEIYVFRASTGELMAERSGIDNLEYGPQTGRAGDAYAEISTFIRGRQLQWHSSDNANGIYGWAMDEGKLNGEGEVEFIDTRNRYVGNEEIDGGAHELFAERSLRLGEEIQFVAVNRATGYIGMQAGRVEQNSSAVSMSIHLDGDIVMRPPNLKVDVWRAMEGEEETACTLADKAGDDVRLFKVGNRGSGMISDECITIHTTWLDHSGRPLPEKLPGYTGRLSRLGSADGDNGHFHELGTNNRMAHFFVRPGAHQQVFKVPDETDLGHYYIHIDGASEEGFANFSVRDANKYTAEQGYLNYRPADYVPFKVRNTEKSNNGEGWAPVAYFHRPEFQFSLLSLDNVSLDATDTQGNPVDTTAFIDDSGAVMGEHNTDPLTSFTLTYELLQDNATEHGLEDDFGTPVNSSDGDLVFELLKGQAQNAEFDTDDSDEVYKQATWSEQGVSGLTAYDMLTLQLVESHDPGNILWDLDPPRLKLKLRGNKTSIPAGGSEIAYVVETSGKVEIESVEWEIGYVEEGVIAHIDETFAEIPGTFDKKVVVGKKSKKGCLILKATAQCAPDAPCPGGLVAYRIIKVGCECATCPDEVALGSVDFELKLGLASGGGTAGMIRLKEDSLDMVGTPAALQVLAMGEDLDILRDDNDVVYQVQAPKKTADISVISGNSYQIALYDNQFITGSSVENDQMRYTFTSPNDADMVWTITKETDDKLRLERLASGVTETYEYTRSGDEWTLKKGTGDEAQVEEEITADSGGIAYDVDRQIKNAAGISISSVRERMQRLYNDENEEVRQVVIERTEGVGLGETRTTTMNYVEAASSLNQGKLSYQLNPDGSWSSYAYNDTNGQMTSRTDVWLDGGAAQTQGKTTSYTYHGNEYHKDKYLRAKEVGPGGEVLSETVYDYSGDREDAGYIMWSGRCATSGCDLTSPGTVVTETEYYGLNDAATGVSDPPWSGKVKRIVYPDGRADYYKYERASLENGRFIPGSGDYVYETVTHGTALSANGVALRTTSEVSVYDQVGNLVQQETYVWTGSSRELLSKTVNTYDKDNHLIKTVNSDGTMTENVWGCCGQSSSTDRLGVSTTYLYDELRRVAESTRLGVSGQDNIATTYTYDAAGRQLSSTVTAGMLSQTTTNTYDHLGRILTSTDGAGQVTMYRYPDALTTEVTMPGGATQITTRFKDGRTKSVTGTGVVPTYYGYTLEAENGATLQCTTVRTGGESSPSYQKSCVNMLGQTVRTEQPGTDGEVLVTTNTYNGKGQLVRTATTGMAATVYEYDALGERVRSGLDVDGDGVLNLLDGDRVSETKSGYVRKDGKWWRESRSYAYPESGGVGRMQTGRSLVRASGFSGGVVSESRSYDIADNETVSVTTLNAAAHTETTSVKYADSLTKATSVSVGGRLMTSTDKSGVKTEYMYDALGRRTGVKDARTGTAVTHYNSKGQVDYVKDAAGNRTDFAYDSATGRKVAETSALGKTTRYAYNMRGQLTHTWGDTVYPVQYVYDDLGRRTGMHTYQDGAFTGADFSSAIGNVTTWHYDDASGMLLSKEDAAGQQVSYTYEHGRLKTRVWAQNGTTTYSYDPDTGELLNIDYSDSTPDITFTYDRLGRQVTVSDGAGTRTFHYSPQTLQLVAEEMTGTINEILYRNYDALGRSDGVTTGPEYTIGYGFDASGRFASVDFGVDTAAYSYVSNSGLLSGMQTAHMQTTYGYESKRNLKTTVTNKVGEATVSRYAYAYDAIGRRTSVQNSGTAFFVSGDAFNKYGYNDRNEVTSSNRYLGADLTDETNPVNAEAQAYNYDAIGNRLDSNIGGTAASYAANSLNQYDTVNGAALTYDADGNLTHKSYGADTTYTYNAENRLTEAVDGTTKLTFTYDYMGRRVEKAVYESDVLQEKRQYLYDGWNLIREKVLDATDNVTDTKYYAWGLDLSQSTQGAGGVGGLVAMMDGDAGTTYYYAYDANGNVGQLVDGGDDSIAARYEYDAFGGEIVAVGSIAGENAYRFSTKYFIPELGVYDYGVRLYEPQLGRWLNRDPMGEEGGLQLYSFVLNNPVGAVDVLGEFPLLDWITSLWNSDTGQVGGATRTPLDLVREEAANNVVASDLYDAGAVPNFDGGWGVRWEVPDWVNNCPGCGKGQNFYYINPYSGEMIAMTAYTECQRQLLQKYFGAYQVNDPWFDGPAVSVPSPIDFIVLGGIGTSAIRASVRAMTGRYASNALRVSETFYGTRVPLTGSSSRIVTSEGRANIAQLERLKATYPAAQPRPISTPWDTARQSISSEAYAARASVQNGARMYRIGTTGRSNTTNAQFWSLEHPYTPGYAGRNGIPPSNVTNANFIQSARLKPGTEFITRPAPPVGTNPGGGIEIVVPENGVSLESFNILK